MIKIRIAPQLVLTALFLIATLCGVTQTLTLKDQIKQLHLEGIESNSSKEATIQLVNVWDSLNNYHHNVIYQLLPAIQWQKMLEEKYKDAIKKKDTTLRLRIAYPLAHVYYVQSKINETFPLLEYLYSHKSQLSKKQYATVLIKIEECYRFYKDIGQAIKIRNERVENRFINTFWELYYSAGLYNEAIQDFILFEPIPEKPFRERMTYFLHLGDMYFEAKQLDSAEKYYRIGLKETDIYLDKIKRKEIIEEGNFLYWRGWFNGLIANCLVERGRYAQAKPLLEYFLTMSPSEQRMNSMLPLSLCYLHLGEIKKGKQYLDSAHYYISDKMYGQTEFNFLKAKSDYFNIIHQQDSAYYYLEAYNTKRDLYNESLLKNQSILLLGKMEIDKRRVELKLTQKDLKQTQLASVIQKRQLYLSLIGLLLFAISTILILINYRQKNKSKKLIEAKNIELAAYAEKNLQKSRHNEQLIKELHHRVKNNLQNVYSLLSIQKRRIKDPDTINFVTSVQNRINSMAIVHESLYSDDTIDGINFEQYVKNLIEHIKLTFEKEGQQLQIQYEIHPTPLPLEKIILLGLIINEAVSNAFKYVVGKNAFNLIIELDKNHESYTLTIKDNGPGFKSSSVNEKSLGLKLIQIMSVQLDAVYTIKHDNGVEHTIKFKA